MKLKIQSLLLLMTATSVIFSCSDDDDDKKISNAYVFNGQKKSIQWAMFEDNTNGESGGYSFWFRPTDPRESDNEYAEAIWIDVPHEKVGSKFELKDVWEHDWTWWIEYVLDEDTYYAGLGEEGEMADVKSGTMSVIVKGDNKFEIDVDIVFTDGKTFKLTYSGEMLNYDDVGRKSAPLQKSHSRNK